ncbi:phage terminase small subunit [Fodinisporobacter ferrooxydans]|uniref:Phage terminase small subunit n=1 Tax=Fodinisporobacter ferrooxydans TaxID=2901836 RepID=A0ABY4CKE8_9BACL|nr:phage terminase small subunit [Alicyclobacillaceae bacterium MYW30-H2]
MARARSPDRGKAFDIWQASGGKKLLKDIAAELGLSDIQIRKWKNQDKWDDRLNGNVTIESKGNVTNEKKKGAPIGNKNAVGNIGGGAPIGNKNAVGNRGGAAPVHNTNAVKTGEYQSLWMDALTPEQAEAIERVNVDPLKQLDDIIILYSFREQQIMLRIRQLQEGLTEKQRKVLKERMSIKDIGTVYDEYSGSTTSVPFKKDELVVTEITENEFRVIDDLLKHEEALTRTTERKNKAIRDKLSYLNELEKIEIAKERLRIELEQKGLSGGENLSNEQQYNITQSIIESNPELVATIFGRSLENRGSKG